MIRLELTPAEVTALKNLLLEEAQRIDDDGNEGAFERTLLKSIFSKLRDA